MSEEKWYPEFSKKYVLKDDCLIAIGPEKFITVAEIKRLYAECAELKALLIERVKPDFPKGAELTSFTISDSNTGKVIDVLGGNSALYAKLDDPKPQGEE